MTLPQRAGRAAAALASAAVAIAGAAHADAPSGAAALPARLSETGLYAAGSTQQLAPGLIAFSPQYPLWTDGASKRRWISLPAGTSIDASDPDHWQFPIGTRLWKEFGFGRRVETRFIERVADGSWRFATYVWNAAGTDADLAPEAGIAALPVEGAPNGQYSVPGRGDCVACHDAGASPVLGASALQLSAERDSLAPHADAPSAEFADLSALVARGLLRNLPTELLRNAPRVPAATPTARAALGYLHGNCGHCHTEDGALAGIDLSLAQSAARPQQSLQRTLDSLIGRTSRFRESGHVAPSTRIAPGSAATSVLTIRMASDNAFARMPPLGVRVIDRDAIELIERWIQNDLTQGVSR